MSLPTCPVNTFKKPWVRTVLWVSEKITRCASPEQGMCFAPEEVASKYLTELAMLRRLSSKEN